VGATRSKPDVLEHTVRVAAAPEVVFTHFTDPARMVKWLGVEATLDPRPGGLCRVVFAPPVSRGHAVMSGRFVEVDPPRRLVIAWGWERALYAVPPQSTAVDVTFEAEGEETIVRLVHRRLPPEGLDFHRSGWERYLGRLAKSCS
jgi:uncharacterized protein YndB with AHSA1/START domain